jgi:hypothetical protein
MACHPVIERYLTDLSARLPGPRRWRAAVLDEVRDSLLEGMDAHSHAADNPAAAALRAVAEHGPAGQVARAYAPELAAAWVRRAGLLALGIIPAMAIVWNLALRAGPPSHWQPSGTGLHLAATVIASGVCLTLICSTAALLGTGRLARTIGDHLPAFRSAICAASIAVSAAVLALLGVVAARAVTAPGSLGWPAVLTALALSLAALTGVWRTAYRCSTSCRALGLGRKPPCSSPLARGMR